MNPTTNRNRGRRWSRPPLAWPLPLAVLLLFPLAACSRAGGDSTSLPAIASFTAAQPTVTSGTAATLTAVFSGGSGSVAPAIGPVVSGVPFATGALTSATAFTLTVTGQGGTVTRSLTVEVAPAPLSPIISTAEVLAPGASGTASVPLQEGISFAWTISGGLFADGSAAATGPSVGFSAGNEGLLLLSCTAGNAAGASATATKSIVVALPPSISRFEADPATVSAGAATTLTAVFANGSGTVDHGVGEISSGVPRTTAALSATTAFTLTVAGPAGTASRSLKVTVLPVPRKPVIAAPSRVSSGAGAVASVPPQTGVTFSWTISGGAWTGNATGTRVRFRAGSPGTLTLTCTAANASGAVSAPGTRSVTVVPPPVITGFSAALATVAAGQATALTAAFANGRGTVDHGVGTVVSGVAKSTGALEASTTFTLTVTNPAGDTATARTTVRVGAAPAVITFTTEGAGFAPVIVVKGSPEILWTWADGTTSSSATPSKNYGSAQRRSNTLKVTPWSALQRINLGYDAGDGGSGAIEMVPDQHVSAVQGLELVAPTLQQWCSSYNDLTSLDFSRFLNLDTIECYLSRKLTGVNLAGTPRLKRACFEDCDLSALNLSQSPLLEDLRGAQNDYPTIQFGSIGAHVWHICVRDNPQIADPGLFADMTPFPIISELFIWNDNQSGELRLPSSHPDNGVSLLGDGNHYAALNLAGSLGNAASVASVQFRDNDLAAVDISGCVQINEIILTNNRLDQSQVDALLAALDALGRDSASTPSWADLVADLQGNAAPSAAGRTSAGNLAAKGWTVRADSLTLEPAVPLDTGETRIDFVTRGDQTVMRADFHSGARAAWHWSDGTVTPALPGRDQAKSGLGEGDHAHFLIISNGAALARFGAANGAGRGRLAALSGLGRCPRLGLLYANQEAALTWLGPLRGARLGDIRLAGTGLPDRAIDRVLAAAAAGGARHGRLECDRDGGPASLADRDILAGRGWRLERSGPAEDRLRP